MPTSLGSVDWEVLAPLGPGKWEFEDWNKWFLYIVLWFLSNQKVGVQLLNWCMRLILGLWSHSPWRWHWQLLFVISWVGVLGLRKRFLFFIFKKDSNKLFISFSYDFSATKRWGFNFLIDDMCLVLGLWSHSPWRWQWSWIQENADSWWCRYSW